jgi:hypothetical protein
VVIHNRIPHHDSYLRHRLGISPKRTETAWFLNEEEKETMRLKKQRDFMLRGNDKFERKWIKIALKDPFIWMLGIAFFTSSVAINRFGVFLPTIISGLGYVQSQLRSLVVH